MEHREVPVSLLAKMGTFIIRVEQLWSYQPPASETRDVLGARQVLADPEWVEFEKQLRSEGFLPAKRKDIDQEEEDLGTMLHEYGTGRGDTITTIYLRLKAKGLQPPAKALTPDGLRAIEQRRHVVGWAGPFEKREEVIPDGYRVGDSCPICPGVIGGGHLPGCPIGGSAE